MKKLTGLLLCLVISAASFSQYTMTPEDYLQKSKVQKKTGLILLLGGTACVLIVPIGVLVITESLTAGAIPFVAGLIAIPASIPFLIAARQNKKKGMSLSFKNETAPHLKYNNLIYRAVPSLTMRIPL